jgi:TPR repeat protein
MSFTLDFESLQSRATKANNSEDYFLCGQRKEFGQDTQKNLDDACFYYSKAARKGHKEAQFSLGVLSIKGDDLDEAIYWWLKAAKADHSQAQYNLAICYLEGRGVALDSDQAIFMLQSAAKLKNNKAQYLLAREYYSGKNMPRSFEHAASYLLMAAKSGVCNAMNELAMMYSMGQVGGKANPVIAYGLAWSALELGFEDAKKTINAIETTYPLNQQQKTKGLELVKFMLSNAD